MIPPELSIELSSEQGLWTQALERARTFAVVDQPSKARAADLLRRARTARDDLEEKRMSIKRPILEAGRAADQIFKPVVGTLDEIIAALRASMAAFEMAQENERRAAMLTTSTDAPRAVLPPPIVAGVTSRREWVFEVVDPAAVPREFCSPDSAKIATGPRDIPGVRWYERERITVR